MTFKRFVGLLVFNKENHLLLYKNKRTVYCPTFKEIENELNIITAINSIHKDTGIIPDFIFETSYKNVSSRYDCQVGDWNINSKFSIFEANYSVDSLEYEYDLLFPNFFRKTNNMSNDECFKFCSMEELEEFNKSLNDINISPVWRNILKDINIINIYFYL